MKRFVAFLAVVALLTVSAAFASVDGKSVYESKCGKCHGMDGAKEWPLSGNKVLKGQSAADIEMKLKGYADGSYGGAKAKTMSRVVDKLNPEEVSALAEYIGSL